MKKVQSLLNPTKKEHEKKVQSLLNPKKEYAKMVKEYEIPLLCDESPQAYLPKMYTLSLKTLKSFKLI